MPRYFKTAAAFGAWLAKHGATETELVVGFHKLGSGKPCMTWSESVDEALCHGWIDGVRQRIDDTAYQIRFTPRKASSTWSAINIEKMKVLEAAGRITDAGRQAFALRREAKSAIYSYEQAETPDLSPEDEATFRANAAAWTFFQAQPPGHRRLCIHRIVSAKKAETRAKRLAALIEASAKGERT